MSKEWFEWYCLESSKNKKWPRYRERFLCPCCFMPTLTERAGYLICPICFWEDDGQDSDDAEIVRGGPNHDYSLKEARVNFEIHHTMYRETDINAYEREMKTKEKRMIVYDAFVQAMRSNDDSDWKVAKRIERNYRSK